MKKLYYIGGKYFLKESDEQNSTIILSQLNKEKIEDGISAFYEATQNGKMVPVSVRLYKNGVDCGVSYNFDCMTGGFTQYVEYDNGHVCVSMDRFSIKKHKNEANSYYKQANDMWNMIHNPQMTVLERGWWVKSL